MKKLFFSLIAIVAVAVTGNAQNFTGLSKDNDFKTYVTNQNKFNERVTNFEGLNQLILDGRIQENELATLYIIYNTNEDEYKEFINNQTALLKSMGNKYGFEGYSQSELNDFLIPELTLFYEGTVAQSPRTTCRGRYLAALALNLSVAIGANYACMPLYAAGGFGGILCAGAVILGQNAANYLALGAYEDCIAGNR